MPTLRKACNTKDCSLRSIRGILFSSEAHVGRGVHVPTITPRNESVAHPRFPSLEAVLGPVRNLQETWVDLEAGAGARRFLVAAQYDPALPVNKALRKLSPIEWHGDLIIMRAGTWVFVTDVGARALAIRAVQKYLRKCREVVATAAAQGLPVELPAVV
ncbi:uncharacterized protein B0H18DRAFT_1121992 [Fomitopsis serialis]|uniref:uncharacterized protein n=1 Tax=Fomitopsis serialis TaxID=139415 RepID=UPI0020084F8B|nr:uncharacterized protein B0H18DRAFT_1121976 [Neoantrodia serialis]XP_047890180.1 uncharacterized protein B0H18DRAFT_1121992 [Neoantrodia serialis]KAH9920383.1 hypothetical protein B0H18DRAFT_1121976 [Neoantrodia serialis]KAH9920399.1 hypothetical protein B0H18DRAFT_1121992 [Neoantrodia serialis]